MQVSVHYFSQLKDAVGRAEETVEVDAGATAQDLVRRLADRHGDRARRLLLADNGSFRPSILVFVGDHQLDWHAPAELNDGDVVTLMSPMAGG